ncbi:MAG TPA: hypothetical protein VGV18_04555 [Verrucomicrobiae bacterium]|nr:hypothetical protein [Verrucomicrobiae bacterium]
MASDYYEKRTEIGILAIRLIAGFWELRLHTEANPRGSQIRSDYSDPAQAALDANHADFGIPEFDALFRGIYVPSDLWHWSTCPMQYLTGLARP